MARFSADGQDYTYSLALGTQANLTVCGWFKISTDRNDYSTIFSIDNGTSDNWLMQAGADGTTMSTVFDATTQQGIGSMTVGTWYFICLATAGTTGNIYYRTASSPTVTTVAVTSVTASVNAATLRIGESPWGAEWWNGCVNAVKVYTAQLTAAEAQQESMQYAPARTANLVAFYPLVKAEATDYSGNARTLTGSGATTEDGPPVPWRSGRPRLVLPTAAAGGTTFPVSVAGAVTPSAALARQPQHTVAGSLSPAGVALKQTQRLLTGATTPAGVVARRLSRTFAAAVAPAAALATIRTRILAVAGSVVPAGAMVKQATKLPAGAVALSGAVVKRGTKTLAGTVVPSGAIASIRTRLLALTGALTPAGQVAKQTRKPFAGGANPTGGLTRSIARSLAGAIAPTGAVAATRTRMLALAGAVVPVGVLVKRTARVVAGGVNPAGLALKLLGRILAGGVSPTGSAVLAGGDLEPIVTPPERTVVVAAENRTVTVAAESRVVSVPAESRTMEA